MQEKNILSSDSCLYLVPEYITLKHKEKMKCESAQQAYYDRIFGQSYVQVV